MPFSNSKSIKKVKRIALWVFGIALFLLCMTMLILQVDAVQTWLGRRFTAYLSSQLNAKITVDRVSVRLVRSVVLEGVFIQDTHGDTMVYARELNVAINKLSTKDHLLAISRLTLSGGTFNLNRYHGEQHDNLQFLTDYFASKDTASSSAPWNVSVKSLVLDDMRFRRRVEDDSAKAYGVDFTNLDVSGIHGSFESFHTMGDSIFVNIRDLRFSEQSGFVLNELSGDAKVSGTEIRVSKLVIKSPYTDLHTDLSFRFDSFPDFDEFTHNIKWNSDFKESKVSFKDIAYFATDLRGIDKQVRIDGNFKGTVNKFKGKNVTLNWGDKSVFRGTISMNGLPQIEDTYIEMDANEISSNRKDVESIPVAPFDSGAHVIIPPNLSELGNIFFKGKFSGFYHDFVAYGFVRTSIGSITSDINLKYDNVTKSSFYSGHISTNKFLAGKIAMIPDLGSVTMSLDIKGNGLRLDNINAKMSGKIEELSYHNYNYRHVSVDGQIAKKLFKGSLSINEEAVSFDFNGTIDYRSKLPQFDFIADIKKAQLDSLNLFRLNNSTVLQTHITTQFKGNRVDNIVGRIDIENTNLQVDKKLYHINSVNLISETYSGRRSIDMLSDNIDAHLNGLFEFATLGDAFKEILPQYLPSVILPKKSFVSNQNFTYDIRLKNLNVITENIWPSWDFAPNTMLKGHFNSMKKDFDLRLNTPYIRYGKFTFSNMQVNADAEDDNLDVNAYADRILNDREESVIEIPTLTAIAKNNKIEYTLRLADADTFPNRAHIEGAMEFSSASSFRATIDSSFIILEDKRWLLDSSNSLTFDTSSVHVSHWYFRNENEQVNINGTASKNPEDKLNINLSGFSLEHLNTMLKTDKGFLGGIMDGDIHIKDVYNKLQLESDLSVNTFRINGDTVGNVALHSAYNSDKQLISSTISAIKGSAKIIDVNGDYYLAKKEDNLDFNIKLNNVYLHTIERYIDDILTNIYGKVSADLHLTGTFAKPVFNGIVDLNKASLRINYLQTHYSLNSTVSVSENKFSLHDVKLVDDNNNEATLDGVVTHNYFHDFRFDVQMNARRFQILNTTIKDNSLYYGKANASGYARFYGPLANMNMDISLSPDKGTVVNIPLNSSSDLSKSNYITFIDHAKDTLRQSAKANKIDLSGISLNMNLDMNRNAEMNIIFDEKIGDIISGTGTGSLRLDINTAGNFNMYGTYTIEKGEYLFTLQNLINKKFNIDSGSRITWSGEPYEANVDLSAVYIVYTSTLYNILQDSSYKRRIPVECRLYLANKLMNPTISYEIVPRGLDPTAEGIVKTYLNSEQEVSRQMLSLMVLNQFLPQSGSTQAAGRLDAGAGVGASASELLSNQVSNWISQISKQVNFGVNYRSKDSYSSEEIQLLFSKSLFNDRLTLEGNVGYLSNQNQATSNVVGDFYAEYKMGEGRFSLKGFNRSNADNIINYSQSPYTQGFGLFYRKEFNTLTDLLMQWHLKKNETQPAEVK